MNVFSTRITQANKSEIIVISYEIILESLSSAREGLETEDWVSFQKDLKRVQKLFHELTGALDFQFPLSFDLMSLYRYCGKCIVEAMYQKDSTKFEVVENIITSLHIAFEEVAKEDKSGPVIKNAQTIYAGLTYGRHSLNEVFVNINEANRGFRA